MSLPCIRTFPKALYKQFLEDKNSLTVEQKTLLADGLRKQCSDYQHALDELGEHEQQVRACAWAPFCRKLARECGGWNLKNCKYNKNMELTDDRKAIMDLYRKEKSQASLKNHRAKKRGLEQGTVEQQLDATKKELRKVKKRNKALEGEKKALEDKLSFVKKSLE